MSPESFNSALATRKLEAIDILLIQAKRGSDADRIRAASAILRIAFIPIPTSATDRLSSAGRCSTPGLPVPRSAPDTPSPAGAPERPQPREDVPGGAPNAITYRSHPGAASSLRDAAGAAPTRPPTHSTPINFTTPPHPEAHPLPMDPSHTETFPPRGLILSPNSAHPFPPQTPTSLGIPLIHYQVQHQFSSA